MAPKQYGHELSIKCQFVSSILVVSLYKHKGWVLKWLYCFIWPQSYFLCFSSPTHVVLDSIPPKYASLVAGARNPKGKEHQTRSIVLFSLLSNGTLSRSPCNECLYKLTNTSCIELDVNAQVTQANTSHQSILWYAAECGICLQMALLLLVKNAPSL